MVDGMRCSARLAAARRVMANVSAVEGDDPATVVMGMDQHRAQITAEWIDTITGEISTARIAPPGSAATARLIAVARKLLKRSYQCVTNAEGGVGVGDIVHRRCCARDGGLLALRRRPCGGRRQTALELR
jgi:hypothetical protein